MRRLPIDQPRVVGVETEYGISPDGPYIDEIGISDVPPGLILTDMGYTSAGSRLYIDNANVEYSTPESTSLQGLLSAHFAGEQIVTHVVEKLTEGRSRAVKRSIDSRQSTRGEHENFLIGTEHPKSYVGDTLQSHLAARPVVTGPGWIKTSGNTSTYEPSTYKYGVDPRAHNTGYNMRSFYKGYSKDYTSSETGQRLEIVCGSHGMYAYPLAARVMNTSAVIRLIEHGKYPEDLIFQSPTEVVNAVSMDTTMTTAHLLRNGCRVTALQFEHDLMCKVLDLDLPVDEITLALKTAEITGDLIDGNFESSKGHVEWLDKQRLLRTASERRGATFPNSDDAVVDIKWHFPGSDTIVQKMKDKNMVGMMPSELTVQLAKTSPPDPTRARPRALAILASSSDAEGTLPMTCGWNYWTQNGSNYFTYFEDPYQSVIN